MSVDTPRQRQVRTLLDTRKRQVEQAERIEALLERQPTHHGYAINVKDHGRTYHEDEEHYADVRERFWEDAEHIAKEHGFAGVWGQGRQGGYAQPHPQPRTDDMWPEDVEAWERETFGPFAVAIEDLFREACEDARA